MNETIGRLSGDVRSVLRRREFRALLAGQTASGLGDWLGTLALIALVYDVTGSELAVGAMLVLRLAPSVIGAPVGGVLGDRFDRRSVMIWADLVRAGTVALIPFVDALWWIYVWAFTTEVFSLVFLPARDASVPHLVDEGDLPLANGLFMGATYGSIPIAGGLFAGIGVVVAHRELPLGLPSQSIALFVDAATFVVSAAFVARLPALPAPPRREGSARSELGEWLAGLRAVRRGGHTRLALLAAAFGSVGGGVLFALGIGYVRETLGAGEFVFGILMALYGAGIAVGVGLLQLAGPARLAWWMRSGILLAGAVLVVMGFVPWLPLSLAAAGLFGTGFALTFLGGLSLIQQETDDALRARALAALNLIIRTVLVMSAALSGFLVAHLPAVSLGPEISGRRLLFVVAGGVIMIPAFLPAGRAAGVGPEDPGDPNVDPVPPVPPVPPVVPAAPVSPVPSAVPVRQNETGRARPQI